MIEGKRDRGMLLETLLQPAHYNQIKLLLEPTAIVDDSIEVTLTVLDTPVVPLPPTPFYKVEKKFPFDDAEKEEEERVPNVPADKYNLFFIAFMVLGAGFHLPFNSFVAAVDYFMLTYRRTDMSFIVAVTYTYTTCLAVVFNVVLVNKISTHRRISFGYVAFMISLGSMAILVVLTMFGLVDNNVGFSTTVIATFIAGIGAGVQEASYYGYVGMLPSKYTRAVMLGESFAGLVVSVNRIVTKVTIDSLITNTVIFFSLSIVGEIVCILLHQYIQRSAFIQHYQREQGINDEIVLLTEKYHYLPQISDTSEALRPTSKTRALICYLKGGLKVRLDVSRQIWKLMLGILQVYFVSLLLYPGVATIIPSTWPDGWLAVVLITAFNFSDFIGTMMTGCRWKMSENVLLILGFLRWSLIPALVMTVLPLGQPMISGELTPICIILMLGFTTGYMGSTPMCAASKKVPANQRELSGNLMTMMMLMGLTFGATSALGLNHFMGVTGAEW